MDSFDEALVSRDSAGRFDFKPPGPPVASLPAPGRQSTIEGRDLPRLVGSLVARQLHRVGERADADELVQEACLQIGKTYGFERIPVAPVYQVVSSVVARSQGHSNLGSTDRRAMSVLSGLRRAREQELGRALSHREVEQLFEQVRREWPDARHRPSTNLLERARLDRQDSLWRQDGTMVEASSPWTSPEGVEVSAVDPSSATGRVEESLNGRRGSVSARRLAWDALAELREQDDGGRVPRTLQAVHSPKAVAWARRTMDDYPGGVLGAVDRWGQAGEDEGTVALFAPFGDIDEEDRDTVCELFAAHPGVADELWRAALSASSRR